MGSFKEFRVGSRDFFGFSERFGILLRSFKEYRRVSGIFWIYLESFKERLENYREFLGGVDFFRDFWRVLGVWGSFGDI